jgi:hypothetical protein
MQSVRHDVEISLERVVDCPFGVAQEYAEDSLRATWPAGELRFAARPDLTDRGKPHDEIAVWWRSGSQLFGDAEVVIRFRILRLSTRTMLYGSCLPALATNGTAADRDAVTCMFRAALRDLLERLADYTEQRERRYRLEHPPALGPVRHVTAV